MCTLVILIRPGHDWPVIIGANRDEKTGRPWKSPAGHWPDRPGVVAGQDVLAGGTWLGVNEFGLAAGILNRKGSLGPKEGFRSRGELPLEALDHADAADAAMALGDLEASSYRPFNMAIADNRDAYWLRLAEGESDGVQVSSLPPGISMITSGERNDTGLARIRTYLPLFQKASPPDPAQMDFTAWQGLLGGRIFDAGSGPEGAMCMAPKDGFGTLTSSLIALPESGQGGGKPLWLFCPAPPGEGQFAPVDI